MGFLDQKIEDYIAGDDDLILEVDEFVGYEFPYEEKIPEDDYIALIVKAEAMKKTVQETHYDVYYKMVRYRDWRNWTEGENIQHFYYMKQRYKKNSQAELKFRNIMSCKLGGGSFRLKAVIGLMDAFRLAYNGKSELGSIQQHYQTDLFDSEIFEDFEEDF